MVAWGWVIVKVRMVVFGKFLKVVFVRVVIGVRGGERNLG